MHYWLVLVLKICLSLISISMMRDDCHDCHIKLHHIWILLSFNAILIAYTMPARIIHIAILTIISLAISRTSYIIQYMQYIQTADLMILVNILALISWNLIYIMIYINIMAILSIIFTCLYTRKIPMMPIILAPYLLALYIFL